MKQTNPLRKLTSESTYFTLYRIILLDSLQFIFVQQNRFLIPSAFFGITNECQKKNWSAKQLSYFKDISSKEDVVQEINHITMVYNANFGIKQLGALELLNALAECRLESIFPNLTVNLRMFLTVPAIIASAERSFSKLKLIKNYLKSSMDQDCLINLARLSIESDIARKIDFDDVIRSFAKKKVRKATLL